MFIFLSHVNELKFLFFYNIFGFLSTFLISYLFVPQIINLLSRPFFKFVKLYDYDFSFFSVFDIFSIYLEIAFFTSIFFHIPIMIYIFFSFFKLGLFYFEKTVISFFLKCMFIFFLILLTFGYFVLYPHLISFFFNLSLVTTSDFIKMKIQIQLCDYLFFLVNFFIYYITFFSVFPIFFFLIFCFDKLKFSFIYNKRKFWITFSMIISCFLSPPDFLSLFLVNSLFLFLFESITFFSILKYFYKKY